VFSGRGRGRPRKNNQKRIDPTTDEYFRSEGREGGPSNPIHGFKEVFEEFKYEKYASNYKLFPIFKYLERFAQIGGFIDKLSEGIHQREEGKEEEVEQKPEKASKEDNHAKGNNSNAGSDQEPLFVDQYSKEYLNRDSSALPEEERSKISCDEVFAIYLYEASKKINPEYYKIMLRFVVSYRECLNRYGWEK